MANASLDENGVSTMTAALDSDGSTIVRIEADPTSHAVMVDDNTTGSDNGPTNALIDGNDRKTLMAVSYLDGVTPVPLYADSSGNLLIQST